LSDLEEETVELSVSLKSVQEACEESLPYRASWINHLTTWIDERRGPAWCYYLALLVVTVGGQLAIAWWGGSFRPEIIGFAAVLTGSSIYYLAMIHYLDRIAVGAFAAFAPATCISEHDAADLCYTLTHLPARPVRRLTLIGIAAALSIIAGVDQGLVATNPTYFGVSLPAQLYWRTALIADQILFWNLIYHTIHQLRIVNVIYTQHVRIDLFNLSPLYKLSRLTMCTAVGTVFIAYLWLATYPWLANDYLVIGSWLIGILAALAGFVLPLLGIHRRLVEEKLRWRAQTGQYLKLCIDNFRKTITDQRLGDVDAMLKMIDGIYREQAILDQIPTWPWQPGTIRGLTTTILAPVALWFVVRLLEHFVTF
jgi:hypothetical protein